MSIKQINMRDLLDYEGREGLIIIAKEATG